MWNGDQVADYLKQDSHVIGIRERVSNRPLRRSHIALKQVDRCRVHLTNKEKFQQVQHSLKIFVSLYCICVFFGFTWRRRSLLLRPINTAFYTLLNSIIKRVNRQFRLCHVNPQNLTKLIFTWTSIKRSFFSLKWVSNRQKTVVTSITWLRNMTGNRLRMCRRNKLVHNMPSTVCIKTFWLTTPSGVFNNSTYAI